MNGSIILGVDAGGSRTVAAAYRPDGTRLARAERGAGNVTVDVDAGCRAIGEAVLSLLSQPAVRQATDTAARPYLCVGCAGVEASGKVPAVTKALQCAIGGQLGKIEVISDASLALYAAHGTADGILIISGTGSIGYRRCGKTLLRCGGWGHLLGDEGSGYDVVIRAVRAVTAAQDKGAPPPQALLDALLGATGLTSFSQLLSALYGMSKTEIAALFPAIAACAEEDALCRSLLTSAGEQLGDLVACLLARQRATAAIPVACSGSVLTKCALVRASFVQAVHALPVSSIVDVDEPTRGAIARARAIGVEA